MNIKEFYEKTGGDYQGVLHRLSMEKLVIKFALKFLNDKSYEQLEEALKNNNREEAFRAAHTLKGVCANLGFTHLYDSASELTEALRGEGNVDSNCEVLMKKVTDDYNEIIAALKDIDN